jgi:hypothetical protein
MTLEELKDAIEDLVRSNGEEILQKEVYAEYNYGDYGRTRALATNTDLRLISVRRTAYSESGFSVRDEHDDADYEYDKDTDMVALIKSE